MNRIIGIFVLVLAIVAILFGGLSLANIVKRMLLVGVDTQHLPREVFEIAISSLFVLLGIKGVGYANRKSARPRARDHDEDASPAPTPRAGIAQAGELEVTWPRATMIWWSIAWRSALMGGLAGLIAGFVVGLASGFFGSGEPVDGLSGVVGLVVAVPAGIWAVKTVLAREFRHYRIALVPSTEARLEQVLAQRQAVLSGPSCVSRTDAACVQTKGLTHASR